MKKLFAALVPLAAMLAVASADHPRHHGPPQEAIDACANAKSGDACSFTLPARGSDSTGPTITGTCDTPPKETTLACKPDHPPPHDHDGPPPDGN